MSGSKFVYVTYIRIPPEKLWHALTTPEIIQQYRFGMSVESEWKVGSTWSMYADGSLIFNSVNFNGGPYERAYRCRIHDTRRRHPGARRQGRRPRRRLCAWRLDAAVLARRHRHALL